MASYNGKDIDRVCRASGMSRARAEALLRQYDGRPDRVLEEKCGAVRVYAEPESVVEPVGGLRAAWRGVGDFFGGAWQRLSDFGRRLTAAPGLPVILLALATAPAALILTLAALFMRMPL
ncbi:MAG: hypothetical protein IKS52_13370 [Clostridia bacterium]|nr:hypothetical protein [Clostridia bacterium]